MSYIILLKWDSSGQCYELVPTHTNGLPVQMVPVILYSDDTSGNRSKKWNKFDNWAMLLAGLPRGENAKSENVHFVAASNQLSAIEMSSPIVKDLKELEDGMVMYNSYTKERTLVITPVICFIGDNGRASEIVNHMGGTANLFCRICEVYSYIISIGYSTTTRAVWVINHTARNIDIALALTPYQYST